MAKAAAGGPLQQNTKVPKLALLQMTKWLGQGPLHSLKLPLNICDIKAMLGVKFARRYAQGLTGAQSHVHFSAELRTAGHTATQQGHATAGCHVHEPWNIW